MVLADTSVWIEHFRFGREQLADRLNRGAILMHPFVYGELACGNLKDRSTVQSLLAALPLAEQVTHIEAMHFLDHRRLWGLGLGLIDVHLLASAVVSGCRLWTLDKRLATAAADLGLGLSTR